MLSHRRLDSTFPRSPDPISRFPCCCHFLRRTWIPSDTRCPHQSRQGDLLEPLRQDRETCSGGKGRRAGLREVSALRSQASGAVRCSRYVNGIRSPPTVIRTTWNCEVMFLYLVVVCRFREFSIAISRLHLSVTSNDLQLRGAQRKRCNPQATELYRQEKRWVHPLEGAVEG